MRRVLSTRLFLNQRLTTALLDRLARAGVEEIELFCAKRHLDYLNGNQVDELRHWFGDSPMRVVSLHAPIYDDEAEGSYSLLKITHLDKTERIKATDEIKRALEIADSIPVEFLVQHVGGDEDEYDQDKADAAFNALDELQVFASQLGVQVLVENIDNALSTAERLNLLLSMTHLPVGYCFNTGSAHRAAGVEGELERMKDRVRMVHLNDAEESSRRRTAPLVEPGGTIDWAAAASALKALPDSTPLVADWTDNGFWEDPLDGAREAFDRLEELLARD